jgi:hypothetical protein
VVKETDTQTTISEIKNIITEVLMPFEKSLREYILGIILPRFMKCLVIWENVSRSHEKKKKNEMGNVHKKSPRGKELVLRKAC